MKRPQSRWINRKLAVQAVHIRRPDIDETPLSDAEKWVAIRAGVHPVARSMDLDLARRRAVNRTFPGRVVWVKRETQP